jgi:membrane protein implicated in regulation of membrane protease activity
MRDVIDVRIRQAGGWFWPCFLIFFVIWYWKWVLFVIGAIAALFLLAWGIKCILEDTKAQRDLIEHQRVMADQRRQELARRAEVENALWHAGDPRGTFGLDYEHGKEPGR